MSRRKNRQHFDTAPPDTADHTVNFPAPGHEAEFEPEAPDSYASEMAWLIERTAGDGRVCWWTAAAGAAAWSTDSLQAVRFCREEDAVRVAKTLNMAGARATEHGWG